MTRVLMIGDRWPAAVPGGLNRYVVNLHSALLDRGVESRTLLLGRVPEEAVGVVGVGDSDANLLGRLRAIARGAARASAEIDILDVHFALHGWAAQFSRRLHGVPLVVHFHSSWAMESRLIGEGRARVRLKHLIERLAYRKAAAFVTASKAFQDLLVQRHKVEPHAVHVIPPGVDLDQFSPGDKEEARGLLGLPADAFVVLCVRRLVPRMGIDTLLDAWDRVDLGSREKLLIVVGDGPLRQSLEERAIESGLGNVRFLGNVADSLLPDFYRAADLCVVPSRALEGFGLVVLEALACGTPIVTSDVGGLPEAMTGLDSRLVIPAGESGVLAERIEAVALGTLRPPDRAVCREHAERYSWASAAARHAAVYEQVLGDLS